MKLVVLIFTLLCVWLRLVMGQPALPTPMHRQAIWVQPNPTNVGGYQVRWGTNVLNVSGVNSTNAIIKLDPGQQTIMLRASAVSGTNASDWISNTVRMLKLTLQKSTNGIVWMDETNWTWSISATSNVLFRTRMDWSVP